MANSNQLEKFNRIYATQRVTPRIDRLLRLKVIPYIRYGYDLENVRKVFRRGLTEYVLYRKSGITKVEWAMGRVAAYLTKVGSKDKDLWPKVGQMFQIPVQEGKQHQAVWTFYTYEDTPNHNLLHTTHHYFAESTRDVLEQVIPVVKSYFESHPLKARTVKFDRVEMFGEDKDYRVLLPAAEHVDAFDLALQEALNEIEPSKFPSYRPHISVNRNMDEYEGTIAGYHVGVGDEIVLSIPASKEETTTPGINYDVGPEDPDAEPGEQ